MSPKIIPITSDDFEFVEDQLDDYNIKSKPFVGWRYAIKDGDQIIAGRVWGGLCCNKSNTICTTMAARSSIWKHLISKDQSFTQPMAIPSLATCTTRTLTCTSCIFKRPLLSSQKSARQFRLGEIVGRIFDCLDNSANA